MKFLGVLLIGLTFNVQANWSTDIISHANSLYQPVSWATFGKPINFEISEDQSAGASADHQFQELKVVVNSGLLSSPRLTPDGLRMIICHELGHLFGGAPRKNIQMEWEGPVAHDGMSFLSSEGQADYYAGLSCFKEMIKLAEGDNIIPANMARIGPNLKAKCGDDQLCLRGALAGVDFLNLNYDFPISCEVKDEEETPVLIRDSYPGRQCRLDTIVSASACNEMQMLSLDFDDASKNECESNQRPLCWYK